MNERVPREGILVRFLPLRHSLRTRLVLWNMVILALLLGALGLVTRTLVNSMMLASVDRDLLRRTQMLVAPPPPPPGLGGGPSGGGLPRPPGPPGGDMPPGFPGPPPEGMPPGLAGPPPEGMPPGLAGPPPEGMPAGPPGGRRWPMFAGSPGESGPPRPGGRPPAGMPGGGPLPAGGGRPAVRGGAPVGAGMRLPGPPPMDGPLPAGSAAGAGGAPSAGDLEPGSPQRPVGAPYPVLLLDLKGRVLAPPNQHAPWDKAAGARAARGEIVFTNAALDGRPLRVLSRPFPQTGPPVGVVQGAYPLTEVNRALAGVSRSLLALAPIALLFAALGAALLTGRVLRPVGDMAGAAGRIGAQDLSQRLPAAGKDEFGELAGTFNHMLDRLERGFQEKELLVEQLRHAVEQQRRFTADASHELRTPLAVIKANASLCLQGRPKEEEYRQSVQDINRAADSMTRLVLDLLLLARSDSGQLGRNPITIAVRDLLERAAAHASHREGAPVQVHVVDEPLYVLGNEEELVRVFSNLLENARRYTPAEGKITLAARRSGNAVQVIVADTGVGIAPEHLPHLGERFYRVDASRSRPDGGSGLGLSICKSIVDAHQGRMVFHSTVGTGTTVHVVLPAADNQG